MDELKLFEGNNVDIIEQNGTIFLRSILQAWRWDMQKKQRENFIHEKKELTIV